MTTELVPKVITPSEVFIPNGLDLIISGVEKIIAEETAKPFDIEDEKDREQRKSFSYQISRSKTFVDDKGKTYVGEIKKKTKEIDAERKRFRDQMDKFRDDTREPVTKWEVAEKARVEAERQHEIYLMEWDEAISEHSIFTREKEIEAKEAEFAKVAAALLAKEQAEQREKERIENESRIKKEAEEKALLDAEAKITAEREAKERAELEAKESLIREENARFKAEDDAKQAAIWAENDRVQAAEKAKADQEAAVQKAKDDAAAKAKRDAELENIRLAGIKEEEERKASNKRHQASVNNKAKDGLMETGITEKQATDIIIEIAQGRIPFLQINY